MYVCMENMYKYLQRQRWRLYGSRVHRYVCYNTFREGEIITFLREQIKRSRKKRGLDILCTFIPSDVPGFFFMFVERHW